MPHVKFTMFLLVAAECFSAAAMLKLRNAWKSTALLALALLTLSIAIVFVMVETLYYTGG